jgi:large subunit ribosomal protein L35
MPRGFAQVPTDEHTSSCQPLLFRRGWAKTTALMPKMKSKTGAKKRFGTTGTGRFKRNRKGRRHILTKKSRKRKRKLRLAALVHPTQEHQIRAMLPYA